MRTCTSVSPMPTREENKESEGGQRTLGRFEERDLHATAAAALSMTFTRGANPRRSNLLPLMPGRAPTPAGAFMVDLTDRRDEKGKVRQGEKVRK